MRSIDIIVAALLVVGGLNWGLVGIFNFNLVASIFGNASAISNVIYALVGLSALYQVVQLKAIQRRWGVENA
jgi:uncharacterized membrane protein YuzA (DUF378 family)